MKRWTFLTAAMLTFCAACNNNTRNETGQTTTTTDTLENDSMIATTPIPLDGCYKMVFKDDTVTMRLNVIDSFVTGDLSYHLYAKDQNDGSIKGVLRDSIIIADYTFRSEGMLSVRQVAFKMQGTALVEGYGELNTSSDTVRFRDLSKLTYQYDRPLIKIPCIQ